MEKLSRVCLVLFIAIVASTGFSRSLLALPAPGDIAPRGDPDGDVNVADLELLTKFANQSLSPSATEKNLCDIAPLGGPDGELTVADVIVLEQSILGMITLPAPVSAPLLWGGSNNDSPYFISGLALENATVNIYRNGMLYSSVTTSSNGLFSASVDLVAGAANAIYVKTEYNGIESAASNTLSPVLPAAIPPADLGLVTIKNRSNGNVEKITGIAGAVVGGATVIVKLVDGSEYLFTANSDGSFNETVNGTGSVASFTVSDGGGNYSEQAIITTVGTLAGTFDVDPSGAATYSIPIAVPPGTAGMAPSLSLNYSSNGGNGALGRGWSLGGLSVISRCPQTIAQDGGTGGVNLNANDRFCLDGQRLVAIGGGAYGGDGTEYRTEIESFTKVVSHGGTGTSPNSFTAWTRSGQVIQYGSTGDSQFNPAGADALLWAASRIEDRVGNYISVTYHEDLVLNEHYPELIEYTLNDKVGLSTPNNSVQLVYASRPDAATGYVGGHAVASLQRLKNIHVLEGSTVIRDYRLSYDTSPTSGMSRLHSIMECESDASDAVCLAPSEFSWSNGTAGYMAGVTSGSTNSGYANALVMDVNGDGKQDLLVPHGGYWWINFGDESGLLPEQNTNRATSGQYVNYSVPIDYNSDGKGDLLIPKSNGFYDLLLSTGDSFTVKSDIIPNHLYTRVPKAIDLTGDGRQDLIVAAPSVINTGYDTMQVYINTPSGFAGIVDTGGVSISEGFTRFFEKDNNYDGRLDLVKRYDLYSVMVSCDMASCQYGFAGGWPYVDSIVSMFNYNNQSIIFMDVNGDSLTDLAGSYDGTWKIIFDNGKGMEYVSVDTGLSDSNWQYSQPVDYNNDGRTDILVPKNGKWYVYQSNGYSFEEIDTSLINTGYANTRIMDVDGDGMQDIVSAYNGEWNVHFRAGSIADKLTNITNGSGVTTQITYKPLTDEQVYTKGASAVFPDQDYQGPQYVVSETAIDDGIGGQYVTDYRYAGAKLHLQGRGLPGFREVSSIDPQTGITTTTTYRQDFPYTGMPETSESFVDGRLIARTDNTYVEVADINGAVGVHFPHVSDSTELRYDLPENKAQGALIKTTVTSTTYDSYGNPGAITVTVTGAGKTFASITGNTYDAPDLSNWVLDRVNRTSVLHQAQGVVDITRTSAFTYYPVGHPSAFLLEQEIIEPDEPTDSSLRLESRYEYDAFGNKTKVTVTGLKGNQAGSGTESRATTTVYDVQGRFPVSTTNAIGHTETYTHDPRYGTKTSLLGPNGQLTTWEYDDFGRKMREIRADGTKTTWAYDFCNSTDCPHGGFVETVTASGSAPLLQYHDALQRVIRTGSVSLTGQTVYQDTTYDYRGTVASKSRPYFAGGIVRASSFDYDVLGRPVHEQAPDGGIVDYVYTGFARNTHRHHTGGDYDQYDTRVNDAMDQLVSVIDAENGIQGYVYDAAGNLTAATDSAGNTIVTGYDLRGRKTAMDDPDMGHWEYRYNAFGELVWQQDAKNQVVTMAYDKLGRVVTRNEPEGSTTWVYDTSLMGKGKLASVAYAGSGHATAYAYDSLGRLSSETSTLDAESFTMAYSYDGFSRRETVTYPTGFMVRNVYNTSGQLVEVRDAVNDSRYWQADEDDAEGRVTLETLGNGLQTARTYDATNGSLLTISTGPGTSATVQNLEYRFNALGNLQARTDTRQNLTETFAYDNLNRLVSDTLVGVGTKTYRYNALGNILRKSDYADTYIYGSNAGPHAVTEVKNGATSIASYTYDANGNMTGGAGRSIRWTSFNKAESISKGATTLRFAYDADHNRIRQVSGTRTTYYLSPRIDAGTHYEKEIDGTDIEHKHYIYAGGRSIAIYAQKSDNTEKTRYLHTDHLGSTDAITDESGALVERMSFAAFGSRRHADWDNTTSVLAGNETHHGFTGHEHLDEVGVIHMNGRLYDPQLGRFLSPDVQIQYPDQTQSFNRYTYVNNNPLSFTDPSGYGFFSKLWKGIKKIFKVIKPIIAIVAAVWTFGWTAIMTGSWVLAGAASGFVGGLISTGTPGGAVAGGFIGGFIGGLTGGLSQGLSSVWGNAAGKVGFITAQALGGASGTRASGGKWQDGFLTGAAFAGVSVKYPVTDFKRVVANGAVGGLSSELQGGKFADGFTYSGLSASARYLYNKVVTFDSDWSKGKGLDPRGPNDPPSKGTLTIGGQGQQLEGDFFKDFSKEGGFLSNLLNVVPGINAVSKLHDHIVIQYEIGTVTRDYIMNYPTMLPAAVITYAGLLDKTPVAVTALTVDGKR